MCLDLDYRLESGAAVLSADMLSAGAGAGAGVASGAAISVFRESAVESELVPEPQAVANSPIARATTPTFSTFFMVFAFCN